MICSHSTRFSTKIQFSISLITDSVNACISNFIHTHSEIELKRENRVCHTSTTMSTYFGSITLLPRQCINERQTDVMVGNGAASTIHFARHRSMKFTINPNTQWHRYGTNANRILKSEKFCIKFVTSLSTCRLPLSVNANSGNWSAKCFFLHEWNAIPTELYNLFLLSRLIALIYQLTFARIFGTRPVQVVRESG